MTHSNDSGRPRSRVTSSALAVLAALWLMPGGLALAATITVTTVADENGSGPNCSLREAIASANGDADVGGCVGVGAYGPDTIVFGSTLSLPATITLTDPAGALTVSSDVTVTGPGATELAIDGNHTTPVFSISTGQVVMSDLTRATAKSLTEPRYAAKGRRLLGSNGFWGPQNRSARVTARPFGPCIEGPSAHNRRCYPP